MEIYYEYEILCEFHRKILFLKFELTQTIFKMNWMSYKWHKAIKNYELFLQGWFDFSNFLDKLYISVECKK